ncbi:hypothetical protein COV06_00120 [Candidatus Uhrbacteria bacterium CG10_big_fil_rev_8_21_14_0_10_50_16]|uniref:Uncharacterized protein n=1 Tax=Candidatus Uhrbacteria bacterium CG10_big_fil_rev_8_21_14_0_10_50_16 TaxID=1975039 RepID=A0A2H0RNM9_9BACT|nr:MAG: hypothetical protein COV06_00120 [Candidatus Uhrbacteria bacterium CG10_big_fil_rev_8_21_14_0_10_50_16]
MSSVVENGVLKISIPKLT